MLVTVVFLHRYKLREVWGHVHPIIGRLITFFVEINGRYPSPPHATDLPLAFDAATQFPNISPSLRACFSYTIVLLSRIFNYFAADKPRLRNDL